MVLRGGIDMTIDPEELGVFNFEGGLSNKTYFDK
jgi:hypothetical protein